MNSFYGTVVKKIIFPLNEIREGTRIRNTMKFFEDSQYWPEERILEFQLKRLKAILNHAFKNTDFYRRRFNEVGFKPDSFKTFDDLQKIPILTKQDLKNHLSELMANNYAADQIHESTTGGTTADYTTFYRDNECLNFKLAATIRHDRWCGWDVGEKEAIVWPASIDFKSEPTVKTNLRNILLDRKLRLFAGVLDRNTIKDICRKIEKFNPVLIRGFPNPISVLAEFIENEGQYNIRPKAIKSVGEPLSGKTRKQLEDIFGCEVFNYYLSRESGTIASECDMHHKMHINAECLYVEFIKDSRKAREGETGNIVITDLFNMGMPLIRYQLGDVGIPSNEKCPCGRGLPLMEISAGRESDFIISPHDGSFIMGLSLLVPFVENPKVGQLQIVQDRLDHIIIRISKNREFNEDDLERFKKAVENIFKGKMTYNIEYVSKILHERSGKYRFVIRKEF